MQIAHILLLLRDKTSTEEKILDLQKSHSRRMAFPATHQNCQTRKRQYTKSNHHYYQLIVISSRITSVLAKTGQQGLIKAT